LPHGKPNDWARSRCGENPSAGIESPGLKLELKRHTTNTEEGRLEARNMGQEANAMFQKREK